MKTYGKERVQDRGNRNPFDELFSGNHPSHRLPNLRCSGRTRPRCESHETGTHKFSEPFNVYVDPQKEINAGNVGSNKRAKVQLSTKNPRIDTPIAVYYPRMSRKPVRSPRISRIVTNKSSSEDELESEDLCADDSWKNHDAETLGIKSSSWTTVNTDTASSTAAVHNHSSVEEAKTLDTSDNESAEYSSIEFPREATIQPIGLPEVDLLVKDSSPALEISDLIESENSSQMVEIKGKQRLNSTLLNDDFAKNIDELKGMVNVSPILLEASRESDNFDNLGQSCDNEEDRENDIEMEYPIGKQTDQETTPIQKGYAFKLVAPMKAPRWSMADKIKRTKENGKTSNNVTSRKKLSPMYNKVPMEDRRILKKTSTPVRNALQQESPPVFATDLSSVQDDSSWCVHQSIEVNSEEIHVSLDSSPMYNFNTHITEQSNIPVNNINVDAQNALNFRKQTTVVGEDNRKDCSETKSVKKRTKTSRKLSKGKNNRKVIKTKSKIEKRSVFSFSSNSSEDEELPLRRKSKTCLIRSESPSREKPSKKNFPSTKLLTSSTLKSPGNNTRKLTRRPVSILSSPPSSKKSVTWGSATRHEYNELSPVFNSAAGESATKNTNQFPICLIIALDHCWTSETDQVDASRSSARLSKPRPRKRHEAYDLDVLCKEW